MVRLGQRLFEVGLGDAALREQYQQIHERILNLQAAKSSTRKLEAERRGVLIRLAESVLNGPAPPEVAEEFSQASQATAAQHERRERLAQERAQLLPPDRPSRLRVGAGLAAIGIAALFVRWMAGPYIGLGPSLGPRAGELIGMWSGTHQLAGFGMKIKTGYTIQFRRDGRVRWEEEMLEDSSGMTELGKKMVGDTSESAVGTGKWHVDHAEGNVFSVRVVSDLQPDETKAFGWRATLEGSDKMTLVNFIDVPLKLTRD